MRKRSCYIFSSVKTGRRRGVTQAHYVPDFSSGRDLDGDETDRPLEGLSRGDPLFFFFSVPPLSTYPFFISGKGQCLCPVSLPGGLFLFSTSFFPHTTLTLHVCDSFPFRSFSTALSLSPA